MSNNYFANKYGEQQQPQPRQQQQAEASRDNYFARKYGEQSEQPQQQAETPSPTQQQQPSSPPAPTPLEDDPKPYTPALHRQQRPNYGEFIEVDGVSDFMEAAGIDAAELHRLIEDAGGSAYDVRYVAEDGTEYGLKDNRGAWQQWKEGRAEIPGIGGQADNAARGILAGAQGYKDSVSDLAASAWNAGLDDIESILGPSVHDAKASTDLSIRNADEFNTDGSLVGGATRAITQFAMGFVTGGTILRGTGLIASGGKQAADATRVHLAGRAAAAGAVGEFIAFHEHEERLSNLIQSHPSLENPVTAFLAADEEDSAGIGRLKMAVEGAGLGLAAEALVAALRTFRRAKAIQQSHGDEAAQKVIAESSGEVEAAVEAAVEQATLQVRSGPARIANVKLKPNAKPTSTPKPNVKLTPEQRTTLTARITRAIERGEDPSLITDGIDFNFTKLENSGQLHDIINSVSEAIPDQMASLRGGSQSLRQISDAAELLGQRPATVIADLQRIAADQAAVTKRFIAGKMQLVSLSRQIGEKARAISAGGGSVEEMTQLARLMDIMADLQANVKAIQTGSARTTSAGRINIYDSLDDLDLDAVTKIIERGGDGTQRLRDLANRIAIDPSNPRHVLKSLKDGPLTQRLMEAHNHYWMGAILSGPRTHGINVLSPAIMTVARPMQQTVGGFVRGVATGDFRSMKDGMSDFMNLRHGFIDGVRFAAKALKAGENILDPQHRTVDGPLGAFSARALGLPSHRQGGKGIVGELTQGDIVNVLKQAPGDTVDGLGMVVGLPFRFLGMTDEFFKQVNYRARLATVATREGIDKGLTGDALNSHVSRRLANGFDEAGRGVDKDALRYAQEVTFTQPVEYGWGKLVQDGVVKHPFLRNFAPFIRTPTNLIRETWKHAPAGINLTQRQLRQDLFSGDPTRQAKAIGQITTGNLLAGSAWLLAAEGKITGHGPSNHEERKVLMATGWRPYSFVREDADGKKHYYSFGRIDPFAAIFGIAADMHDISGSMDEREYHQLAWAFGVAVTRNLMSKTWLTGVSEAIDVLDSPDTQFESWMQRRAGSYVPNFLNQTNPDPLMREVRSMLDAVKAKTPGFSETLPPRRNIFGEPLPYDTAVGPDFISPFAYSKGLNDSVREELASLESGFGHPSQEQGRVDLTQFRNSKGQDAYDRWLELHGQVKVSGRTMHENLERAIGSSKYQSLRTDTDEGLDARTSEVRRVIGRHRMVALRKVREEYPELHEAMQSDERERRGNLRKDVAVERAAPQDTESLKQLAQ